MFGLARCQCPLSWLPAHTAGTIAASPGQNLVTSARVCPPLAPCQRFVATVGATRRQSALSRPYSSENTTTDPVESPSPTTPLSAPVTNTVAPTVATIPAPISGPSPGSVAIDMSSFSPAMPVRRRVVDDDGEEPGKPTSRGSEGCLARLCTNPEIFLNGAATNLGAVGGTSTRADVDLRGVDVAAGVHDDESRPTETPIGTRSIGYRETSGEGGRGR